MLSFLDLKGDKPLWVTIGLFILLSFAPIFSASTNLEYVVGVGKSEGYLLKHFLFVVIGVTVLYALHRVPQLAVHCRRYSILLWLGMFSLLTMTSLTGNQIGGADASRWTRIPIIGISIQPSLLMLIAVVIYTSSYLAKYYGKTPTFKESLWLWLGVGLPFLLILKSNLSMAIILTLVVFSMCVFVSYSWKNIFSAVGLFLLIMTFFILFMKAFPTVVPKFSNRVDTWQSRIETFFGGGDKDDNYQIECAKTAIATGGIIFGRGPGKSVMKNFLPQSSSDFIFAIIAEEYGIALSVIVVLLYIYMWYRIVVIIYNTRDVFSKLIVLGLGLVIITQAMVNMSVVVQLIPVTGQNLPFFSLGGTSIITNCVSLGIILSISANNQKIKQQLEANES